MMSGMMLGHVLWSAIVREGVGRVSELRAERRARRPHRPAWSAQNAYARIWVGYDSGGGGRMQKYVT